MRRLLAWSDGIAAACFAALILTLSLFPFIWRVPAYGAGPLATLADSWARLSSPGDVLANIVFYAPLGFFGTLALWRRRDAGWRSAVPVLLFAAALSLGCELAQYYVAQRQTSASDVYANLLGALCGAGGALALGRDFRAPVLRAMAADCFPALLLLAWLASRLLPHVEAAYFHVALRPVVFLPILPPYDLFRNAVEWLIVCALVEAVLGGRRWGLALALCAVAAFGGALLAPLEPMNFAEAAGLALAAASWPALRRMAPRRRFALLAILACALLVAARLEPFVFLTRGRPFGWLPFRSLVYGPDTLAIQSLLEKFVVYGSALWLLGAAGMRQGAATLLVVLALFLTSLAQTHLPWRSAEITDAVLGLMFAGLRAALRRAPLAPAPAAPPRRLAPGPGVSGS